MRKILTLVGFVGFSIFTWAQVADSIKVWPEIVHLEEVNVAANFPLNNNNVVDFYRTNHFATLDNINGRLDGMSLIKRGAYAQEPQLNGFSGGQLNVTIDGMKMFGACTDKMDPITRRWVPGASLVMRSVATNGPSSMTSMRELAASLAPLVSVPAT
jgi:iron complex outermembrane receptor protein